MSSPGWSDEHLQFLRDNWLTMTRQEIADRLGRTRTMVIGMGFRLHLPNKTTAGRKPNKDYRVGGTSKEYTSRRARERVQAEQKRAQLAHAIAQVLPSDEAKPFRAGFCFCGKTRLRPYPYCEAHRPKRAA